LAEWVSVEMAENCGSQDGQNSAFSKVGKLDSGTEYVK